MRLLVPYICPVCDHDRWVSVDLADERGRAVKCPRCGDEDEIQV